MEARLALRLACGAMAADTVTCCMLRAAISHAERSHVYTRRASSVVPRAAHRVGLGRNALCRMLHAACCVALGGARRRATGCAIPATAQVAIVFVDYHVELMSVSAWQPILSYIRPVLGVMLVRAVAPTQHTVPAKLVDPRARTHARTARHPPMRAQLPDTVAPQLLLSVCSRIGLHCAVLRCAGVGWSVMGRLAGLRQWPTRALGHLRSRCSVCCVPYAPCMLKECRTSARCILARR